jgi:hypothetical protein
MVSRVLHLSFSPAVLLHKVYFAFSILPFYMDFIRFDLAVSGSTSDAAGWAQRGPHQGRHVQPVRFAGLLC